MLPILAAQALAGKIAMPVPAQPVDVDKEIRRAIVAFTKQRFRIFVNGRQMTELDQTLPSNAPAKMKFMRIMPLAGG